jgi:hypothetical protein
MLECQEFAANFLQFVYHYPTTLHCLRFNGEAQFHLNGFINKQNTRFLTSENPHNHENVTPSCNTHHVACNQQTCLFNQSLWRAPIQTSGTYSNCNMRSFQSFREQGMWTQYFSSRMVHIHRSNFILDILYDMSGRCILSKPFPENLRCGWS